MADQLVHLQTVICTCRFAYRVRCVFVRSCVRACIGVSRRACARVKVNVFYACVYGLVGRSLWWVSPSLCVCVLIFIVVAGRLIGYVAGQIVRLQSVGFTRRCACRGSRAWFVSACVYACSRERVLFVRVRARASDFAGRFSL